MATNPYQGQAVLQWENSGFQYIPPADIGNQNPVPAGTTNQYGVALWIPQNYPVPIQPYADKNGRVILRPLRKLNYPDLVTMNQWTAYILTALQYAVNTYSSAPYNVANNTKLWSGPAVVQSYFIAPPNDHFAITTRLTMGSWDPDWIDPVFPQNTLLDSVFNAGKAFVMSTFASAMNAFVPGLGIQLENAVNKASLGGVAGVSSLSSSQQNAQQTASTEKTLLSSDPSSIILYAAAIVVVVLIILIS